MIDISQCWLKGNCKAECKEGCIKLFKLDYLYDQALIPINQRSNVKLYVDADGTDKQAFMQLKEIESNIDHFIEEGKNLFIRSSTTGNGKSAWSLKMIQSYFNKIWYKSDLKCKALFINVPKFLIALKDNISKEDPYVLHIKDNVLQADIVVWDEVGVKSLTAFEHEQLYTFIEARTYNKKSNIYTSNLTLDELKEKCGDRLYSRIVNFSINFEFFGQDKRNLNV